MMMPTKSPTFTGSAVNTLDEVTEQNAAMVEKGTAAAHSLAREVESLLGLVDQSATGEEIGDGIVDGRNAKDVA